MSDEGLKRFQQLWSCQLQFLAMGQRKPPKQVHTVRRQMQQDFAPVRVAPRAPDQAMPFQPVGQLHGAVMPDL